MRIFLTGATGALGRPVLERLRRRGDEVFALAHSDAAEAKLREMEVTGRRADVIGRDDLTKTVEGCDAILHLATRIPAGGNMLKMGAWKENNCIREEGCERLIHAARNAGIETIVFPSITMVYPDSASDWIDAKSVRPPVTAFMRATLNAERSIEKFTEQGGRGIVLRMGQFYGHDRMTQGLFQMAQKGWMALFGPGHAYFSWIWIDDAADAVVAALDAKMKPDVYDIVDDEPITRDQLVAQFATLKRKKIRRVPEWLFKLFGREIVEMLSASRRVRNRRFREAADWSPTVPRFSEGLRRVATAKAREVIMERHIAILGTGNIGGAIASGLVSGKVTQPNGITLTRRRTDLLAGYQQSGYNVTADNLEALSKANIVIVAVEPQQLTSLSEEIRDALDSEKHLIISVVSGASISPAPRSPGRRHRDPARHAQHRHRRP